MIVASIFTLNRTKRTMFFLQCLNKNFLLYFLLIGYSRRKLCGALDQTLTWRWTAPAPKGRSTPARHMNLNSHLGLWAFSFQFIFFFQHTYCIPFRIMSLFEKISLKNYSIFTFKIGGVWEGMVKHYIHNKAITCL